MTRSEWIRRRREVLEFKSIFDLWDEYEKYFVVHSRYDPMVRREDLIDWIIQAEINAWKRKRGIPTNPLPDEKVDWRVS
jgi:hypothetical protein